MGAQHTRGPWEIENRSDKPTKQIAAFAADGNRVLCVRVESFNLDADECLIAAAPDLLAALKAVDLARHTDAPDDWQRATDLTDAAIARAEGR